MAFLELFEGWKRVETFDAGSVIYCAEQPAQTLFVVLEGEVELRVQESLLTVECKGGIIGEMALLQRQGGGATAQAMATTTVRLAVIEHEDIQELVARSTEFSLQLMSVLTDRLRALDNYISERMQSAPSTTAQAG